MLKIRLANPEPDMPQTQRPPLPWEGGCRCGRVRLRVTQAPLLTMACHCLGCQRMSASAFSLTMAVPSSGFEVIAGEPVIGGIHGDQAQHHHCDWCKSWLFTRVAPEMGFVNVRPSVFDDHGWFEPFVETQTAEMLPWARTPAKHSFARFPAMDAYAALVAEFQNTPPAST
jgi:hypothetical protein